MLYVATLLTAALLMLHLLLTLLCVTEVHNDSGSTSERAVCSVVIMLMVELPLMILHNCNNINSSKPSAISTHVLEIHVTNT